MVSDVRFLVSRGRRFYKLEVATTKRQASVCNEEGVDDRGVGAAVTTPTLQEGDVRGAELLRPLCPPYAKQGGDLMPFKCVPFNRVPPQDNQIGDAGNH